MIFSNVAVYSLVRCCSLFVCRSVLAFWWIDSTLQLRFSSINSILFSYSRLPIWALYVYRISSNSTWDSKRPSLSSWRLSLCSRSVTLISLYNLCSSRSSLKRSAMSSRPCLNYSMYSSFSLIVSIASCSILWVRIFRLSNSACWAINSCICISASA